MGEGLAQGVKRACADVAEDNPYRPKHQAGEAAFSAPATSDKLFHVQVGPFGDIKEAEIVRGKLVGDGYNPILKK